MKTIFSAVSGTLGVMALATLLAPAASAGCGDVPGNAAQQALMVQAAYRPAAFRLIDNDDQPSIVGMWSVEFTAGGNTIDFGYAVWHSDGTEIMNSGGRAPATENFCLGVWKRTGRFTYKLNHLALSYDMTGNLNARVNIREDITLAHNGKSFSGTFTIDVYDPNTGTTLYQHVEGDITGTRVTVN
jgi:hypothetical protein